MAGSKTVWEQAQNRLHELQEQVETLRDKVQHNGHAHHNGVDLSRIKMPDVKMPEIHAPQVRLPSRNVPKFHLGRLKVITALLGLLVINRWFKTQVTVTDAATVTSEE